MRAGEGRTALIAIAQNAAGSIELADVYGITCESIDLVFLDHDKNAI
ncbi:hypothetical protein [Mycobacterium holsaticum]